MQIPRIHQIEHPKSRAEGLLVFESIWMVSDFGFDRQSLDAEGEKESAGGQAQPKTCRRFIAPNHASRRGVQAPSTALEGLGVTGRPPTGGWNRTNSRPEPPPPARVAGPIARPVATMPAQQAVKVSIDQRQ